MKLIKNFEKPILKKTEITDEPKDQHFQQDGINTQQSTVEEQQELQVVNRKHNYTPLRDRPIVQSVGNSGWQVSDIWKDIRLDGF
ncbi:hypothetical protein NIES4103_30610 [Nostoc sp. NIES-4103]|nr:hypothetical protein NIES4103_30610 [Nostoc sp. NIES-4103]